MRIPILKKWIRPKSERDYDKHILTLIEVNQFAEQFESLQTDEFPKKTEEFKKRLQDGETLDDILPEAFGLVKAACKHLLDQSWDVCGIPVTWDMVPYDVQTVGAIILHSGAISEMATGEGKTLAATMPMYLNALTGKGVHLITVNDYLARRDAQWMGRVYELLGLSVGCIQADMSNEDRIKAYNADITYGTNNEFGFDYLRDNMKTRAEDKVQRSHHYAIVDEVDSVLIDEARTPLIISGPVTHGQSSELFVRLRPKVERVVTLQNRMINQLLSEAEKHLDDAEHQDGVARTLLKVQRGAPKTNRFLKLKKKPGVEKMILRMEADLMREKILHELDEELYFAVDEKANTINLTEKGREALAPEDREQFVLPDLSEVIQQIDSEASLTPKEKIKKKDRAYRLYAEKSDAIHNFNQLLKAYTLFERDVEYVVQDGRVIIVDEFTGRLMPGRRFSDGLHQALEAKEGVKVEGETQTLATITLQNYFRLYDKLAGMTGTAETEAEEFYKIYKLDVSVIPTNEMVRRIDFEDMIYRTKREKYNAIVEEIERLHGKNLPVLVGTVSVEVSETLSRLLKRKGIKHNVLNAKYHQKEAEIVAHAGKAGAVTIATNMAGRGTDIKLAPEVVQCETCGIGSGQTSWNSKNGTVNTLECEKDVPCGLHIVGTERHEARRIDRQLRGRSGRQGDPGASQFFLCLEDDLMRLFGSERVSGVMDRLGIQDGEVITHKMVTRAIERAQRRVENYNFGIRKRLLEYDDVMNKQREVIYKRRDEIIEALDLKSILQAMIEDHMDASMQQYIDPSELPEHWPLTEMLADLESMFLFAFPMPEGDIETLTTGDLQDYLVQRANEALEVREGFLIEELGSEEVVKEFEKYVMLQTIDEKWMDHLHELDYLKEGIHFRAYAQKDPLIEYKKEAFSLFGDLNATIDRDALYAFFHARIATRERRRSDLSQARAVHREAGAYGGEPQVKGSTEATSAALQEPAPTRPVLRQAAKVGRNDPCPCGSGKKYKKCCGVKS
ncbi:MAG: preprotein translocase subunit SecA [Candidatus Latescibacteria bacterium]|nr:preprotein translocase subunit SecA [Candidatus Latescibacterota bacterium]NIM21350.1 preprotein translocase subunit SecA [Candidatus Latescibacterota bacterium]NIM65531.1 preprotein translocase subunit SecA [Candidatus Latescibacterota bacterium]NIO01911.1 preprotein translocase subunit SecA [Candidatus Latescibacterota bacterium]NIO28724.1 preprotein translocase subunit SecA [Candidatus Latescibacterota bacterium]